MIVGQNLKLISKVIFCGDSSVGKTSIIEKLINRNNDIRNMKPTTPVAFSTLKLNDMTLNLWDTAGQETYRSLIKIYFREANLAIVVCDVTSYKSFDSLLNWIAEVEENAGPSMKNCQIIIVANKCDKELERVVSTQAIADIARTCNCEFVEVSALNGQNFEQLINKITYLLSTGKKYENQTTRELRNSIFSDSYSTDSFEFDSFSKTNQYEFHKSSCC